jgi:hypothetical protein
MFFITCSRKAAFQGAGPGDLVLAPAVDDIVRAYCERREMVLEAMVTILSMGIDCCLLPMRRLAVSRDFTRKMTASGSFLGDDV